MAETTLREKIVIDGTEQAAAKLNVMASAAGRVANAFSGIRQAAGVLGGVAGIWQVAEAVRDVDRLYAAVNRVTNLTGMAADHAHAMFDMFELSGVEMEHAERIITSMTRKGAQLADGIGGVGASAQEVAALMHRLGIAVRAGPEERIFAMAKAAQDSKLDVDQLIRAFMIPRSQASAMMTMLKSGPDALRAIQKDTLTGADVIDDRALQTYRSMLQARRELKDAWGDLIGVFYKNLLPGVTAILKGIKDKFDEIKPVAEAIGKYLSKHMETVVSLTRTYLKLLLAAKLINLFSSEKMGIVARGRQIIGGTARALNRGRTAGGAMDYFEARAASPNVGMFGKAGAGRFASLLGSVRGLFGGLASSVGALIPMLGAMLPAIGVLLAIILVAVGVFLALKHNVLGITDALKKIFGHIGTMLSGIWKQLSEGFSALWQVLKPVVEVIGGVLLGTLYVFAKTLELIVYVVQQLIDQAMNGPLLRAVKQMYGIDDSKKAVERLKAENKPDQPPNMDFRGSKFEISNNFPPGIDGGRVAVAFGDELAKLGERRLDSGLRPLYSVR